MEGMRPGGDQAAMAESVDPAKRNQQAIDALTKEAERYGGFERIPGNSPVLRMAVESANAGNSALATLAKSGAAADIDGRIMVAGGGEVGWYSLRQGARDAATAAGVVAGMFQSVGDGVIGAGALLKDVLLAQQYMLGGRDSAWSPNRLLPGFEMKREAFENVRALGQAVAEIAKDPGRFIGDAIGRSIDTVATRLETARDTDKLGDWFLYGASVGNVTVDVASVIAGAAGLARIGTATAGELNALLRARTAASSASVSGETAATATGKSVHRALAAERRASGDYDLVNRPIPDSQGNPIQVTRRVDLRTGDPLPETGMQTANPDAVRFGEGVIIDDKPMGRPVAKDRQEILRFIRAYEQSQGNLPSTIAIQRYDPLTGKPVVSELYKPTDFLPKKR